MDIMWEVHKRTWQGVSAKLESYIYRVHMSILHPHICLISYSRPPCCIYIPSDIIFQIVLLCSRPMTSHHVTCHVTVISRASSLSLKKEKEIQKKRNIKSRKIDKRKRKMLVSKAFHNIEFSCKLHNLYSPLDIHLWDLLISATIRHWSSGCYNSSQITIVHFNENSSGSKY